MALVSFIRPVRLQLRAQAAMVDQISSIWALVMISGGDSAMMSPVVRIRMPFS